MRLLDEQTSEEVLDLILRDEPLPLHLLVKLDEAGLIIDELRTRVLTEYMYKDI